jgi:hypothetical protein
MARIRTIKPRFFRSPDTRALSLHARLTYIGLWTYADDEGRGEFDVSLIRADLWPDDDSENVLGSLLELSRNGQIAVYEHSGRRYFHIPAFNDHQRVDKPRPSEIPTPDDAGSKALTCDDAGFREDSGSVPGAVAEPSRLEGNKEVEVEGNKEESAIALRDDRADAERLCSLLADRIEGNGSKRPTITDRWRDAARLMIDKDGRTEEQIAWLIEWCQRDEFWRANVLSMPKLREKFDQLRLQATSNRGQAAASGHTPSTTDQRVGTALALAAKYAAEGTQARGEIA